MFPDTAQPLESVIVILKTAEGRLLMFAVVSPLLHKYEIIPVPPEAVRVIEPTLELQVEAAAVMLKEIAGGCEIFTEAFAMQPLESVAVKL